MQNVIREGSLRLLATESSCDVIISCLGFKLVAHKIILSIASPVLQALLEENAAQQPTMLIFPDVAATTMSLILDYIYTGHVTLFLAQIAEFLALIRMLGIQLEDGCAQELANALDDHQPPLKVKTPKMEAPLKRELEIKLRKLVPDLIPLTRSNRIRERRTRGLFNKVIPSPWTPRERKVLEDPRSDRLFVTCNDPNNNIESTSTTHFLFHKSLQLTSQKVFKTSTIVSPAKMSPTATAGTAILLHTEYPHFATDESNDPEISKECAKSTSIAKERDTHAECESRLPRSSPLTLSLANDNRTQRSKIDCNENIDTAAAIRFEAADTFRETTEKCDILDIPAGKVENSSKDEEKIKKKPFKCDDCGKQFSQLRNYKYHRSIHDGTKEFATRCPECGKVFNDKGYLSSHMKIHRDRKEYACQHCPKRFNQRVAYNMHLRIHTGVKPHECSVCGKSFSRKMLLKQHQRVHTGERPYTCAECGKSFADRSNMSLHARLHTGVKPYSCTLCPKSFTKKHHLKTHMNFHTGLKPYSCEKCGLSFSQSSNMRTHYKKCILKTNNNNNAPSNIESESSQEISVSGNS